MGVALVGLRTGDAGEKFPIRVELRAYRGGLRRWDVMRLVLGSNDNDENWLRKKQWLDRDFMEELILSRLNECGWLSREVSARSNIAASTLNYKRFHLSDL